MEPMDNTSSKKSEKEGVDIASFMMSSSVPVTINDLPPEVLEMIIDKLDDQASILNCRLVNFEWKAAAGKAMENRCLSIWTRWNPKEITEKTPIPKIRRTTIFPSPTRSLYLDDRGWKGYKKTNKAAKIETFHLLKLFGSHLTSLYIEGMSLDRVQISIMIKELVNLIALTLELPDLGIRKREATSTVEVTSQPPPNLKYLRLMWDSIEDCDLVQWIVDHCSSKLIHLESMMTRPSRWQPRRFLKLPSSSGTNHLRVTKLKLCGVSSYIFEQTVRLPLKHLSIGFLQDDSSRQFTLKDFITFLNNFSETLVQLYLDVFLGTREEGGRIPFNVFPHLTELFIWFYLRRDPDRSRLTYLHEVFLKRFPNLQRLHLLHCDLCGQTKTMEQARDELNSHFLIQHCFELCQKLETVTVNLLIADADSLRPQNYEITVSRDGDQLWKLLQ